MKSPFPIRNRSFLSLLACITICAGCTTLNVQKIPPQDAVYPVTTAPDAPFVLAIPGLVVPGLRVTQQQHFGYLVEMLAAEGIPCRILTYDTPEDPLSMKAALYSPDLGIAWTRVGPAIVREFEAENERRGALGLPPVQKLVLIGYSQGGVIMAQIAGRIFYLFKKQYEDAVKEFGDEWQALQKDPEFLYFIGALDDFVVIKNIRMQYADLFKRSPSLRRFYTRAEKKFDDQFKEFMGYLIDPSRKYPQMKKFEGIEGPYYPKKYVRIRAYAAARETRSEEERERNKQFFVTYAQYRGLLNVQPSFIATAASLFGSPEANNTLKITKWLPIVRYFIGREYYQIQQTELGTAQQLERIELLVREYRDKRYPISPSQTIFIVGANGPKGDNLVDQPSAHLSKHSFAHVRVVDDLGGAPRFEEVAHDTLPPTIVVPLKLTHFPEKTLGGLGGASYGAAYMVKGNPAYPYILNFIKGDWKAIMSDIARDTDIPRQFMIEVSFADAMMNSFSARRKSESDNIRVTGRYFNALTGTFVWTGYFKEAGVVGGLKEYVHLLDIVEMISGVHQVFAREGEEESPDILNGLKKHSQLLNPLPLVPGSGQLLGWTGLSNDLGPGKPEEATGEVVIDIRLPGGKKAPLTCTVRPGRISFVRIATGSKSEDAAGQKKLLKKLL
ncbi:MAG: hypothetical protein NTZ78_13270 [Candidatus Aureabacteria bacterium]|nr:hypothetical protein [Candidatus Auribacterota bacterium]